MAKQISRRNVVKASGSAIVLGGLAGCQGNSGGGNGNSGGNSGNGDIPVITHGSAPGAELTDYASMFRQSEYLVDEVMPNAGDTYESEVAMFGGSPQIVAGLSSGECDLGVFSAPAAASAVIEGVIPEGYRIITPAKYTGVKFTDQIWTLTDGGLQSPSDFEGASVAVVSEGAAVDVIARTSLREAGVDISQVQFREVGFGAMPSALEEGRVDAAVLIQPFVEMLGDRITQVEGVQNPMGSYMELGIGGPSDYLEENGDIVQDWMEDHWSALQWWNDESNRDRMLEIAAEITQLDGELLDQIINTERDYYQGENGLRMDPTCFQIPIDELYDLDYIREEVDIAQYIDNSFLSGSAAEDGIMCG